MVAIIKIVNTMCLVYILTNKKTRTLLLNTIYVAYSFLLKEIDNSFRRQEEFIHHLVTGLFEYKNGKVIVTNTEVVEGKVEGKVEEKVEEKLEEKFEEKYLQRFKAFKNEYLFTETELELEQQKYEELKKTFTDDKNKAIDEINNKINKIKRIISCVVFDENGELIDVTKDGIQRLIKYFNIEDDYNSDADSYILSDLFAELSEILTESQQKIKEEEEKNVSDDDFKQQAHQYMLNKKLDGYMNNYVNDMTPLGNVYMRYNNSKKSFEYYSNNTIPYRYLEPVGRKFVLTYFCKPLFIDIEEELNKAKLKKEEHDANRKKEQSEKSEQPNDKKNVFAKLKSYNSNNNNNQSSNSSEMMKMEKRNVLPPQMKANLPNVNNTAKPEEMLLKENANRYTWEGRLSNMSLLKKVDRKVVDKKYAMTFADFKRLQKK